MFFTKKIMIRSCLCFSTHKMTVTVMFFTQEMMVIVMFFTHKHTHTHTHTHKHTHTHTQIAPQRNAVIDLSCLGSQPSVVPTMAAIMCHVTALCQLHGKAIKVGRLLFRFFFLWGYQYCKRKRTSSAFFCPHRFRPRVCSDSRGKSCFTSTETIRLNRDGGTRQGIFPP